MSLLLPRNEVATPEEMDLLAANRSVTWAESFGANLSEFWDWTLLGRAQDALQEQHAEVKAYGGVDRDGDGHLTWIDTAMGAEAAAISEDDWKASDDYRDGIEYDKTMTPVRAKLLAEDFDERRARDSVLSRQSTGQKVAGFFLQLGAGFADPVNYIPVFGPVTKLKAMAKFGGIWGRMGVDAADALISGAVVNAGLYADLEARGEQLTVADYMADTFMGAGVGVLLGFGGGAWAKMKGENAASINLALRHATGDLIAGRDVDVAPLLKDVVEGAEFDRVKAKERFVQAGLDGDEAESVLSRFDELAREAGMEPDEWVRQHMAQIDVGTPPDDRGIRFAEQNAPNRPQNFDIVLHRKQVNEAVWRLQNRASNGLTMRVVQNFDELPPHVQAKAREQGVEFVGGATDGAAVYIVSDMVANADQAAKIWMHEQVGHAGLRAVLGDDFEPMMDRVFAHFGEERLAGIKTEYGLDFANVEHRREAAEEMLARFAETLHKGGVASPADRTLWESVRQWLTEWMRKHGVDVELTDDELVDMLKDAARWTMDGKGRKHGDGSVRMGVKGGPKRVEVTGKELGLDLETIDHKEAKDHIREYARANLYGLDVKNRATGLVLKINRNGIKKSLGGQLDKAELVLRLPELLREAEYKGSEKPKTYRPSVRRYLIFEADVNFKGESRKVTLKIREDGNGNFHYNHNFMEKGFPETQAVRSKNDRESDPGAREPDKNIPPTIAKDKTRFASSRNNGSVEFLPDGRAHVRIFAGADLEQAGENLARLLKDRFAEHPPHRQLDWRTAKPENFGPDRLDPKEAEAEAEVLDAGMELRAQELLESGTVPEEMAEHVEAANRYVKKVERWQHAATAAVECIVKRGM